MLADDQKIAEAASYSRCPKCGRHCKLFFQQHLGEAGMLQTVGFYNCPKCDLDHGRVVE